MDSYNYDDNDYALHFHRSEEEWVAYTNEHIEEDLCIKIIPVIIDIYKNVIEEVCNYDFKIDNGIVYFTLDCYGISIDSEYVINGEAKLVLDRYSKIENCSIIKHSIKEL